MEDPIIISIEGNIGSGKSSFLQFMKENNTQDHIYFLQEPVDSWNEIKDDNNITILEKFYKEPKKYAFTFQMMAFISRLSILKRVVESKKYKYIITERSLLTDKNVFCKMLHDDGLIEKIEYNIYMKWFDEFNIHSQYKTIFMYLKCDTYIAQQRVDNRNRKGEKISFDYLNKCNQYHNTWLASMDSNLVTILDSNRDKTYYNSLFDEIKKILI